MYYGVMQLTNILSIILPVFFISKVLLVVENGIKLCKVVDVLV